MRTEQLSPDGCAIFVRGPGRRLHRHATESLNWADALLIGRVTYEKMEAAFGRVDRRDTR